MNPLGPSPGGQGGRGARRGRLPGGGTSWPTSEPWQSQASAPPSSLWSSARRPPKTCTKELIFLSFQEAQRCAGGSIKSPSPVGWRCDPAKRCGCTQTQGQRRNERPEVSPNDKVMKQAAERTEARPGNEGLDLGWNLWPSAKFEYILYLKNLYGSLSS